MSSSSSSNTITTTNTTNITSSNNSSTSLLPTSVTSIIHSSLTTFPKFEIASSDVLILLLQFLKENGLESSMRALEQESGVYYDKLDDPNAILEYIQNGDWVQLLSQLETISLPYDKIVIYYNY